MVIIVNKIENIIIGEKIIEEITDEDGIKWYPLKKFLERILCKYDKVSKFRDTIISRYMKVISYPSNPKAPNSNIKTWCINENGIKYLLRHMNIFQKGNKNINLYRAREKGFFEACQYFHVKNPDKIKPTYINITPNLKDYDIWSINCLLNDRKIQVNTRWKLCSECDYYYPDSTRYFGDNKKKCLQCQNKNFKCQNKIIQFIYDNGGLDLLYAISLNKDEEIVKKLIDFINKGGKTHEN